MDQPNIVLQPHLGRVEQNYKPSSSIGGYLALAKVTKVHYKNRTADVSIINTRDNISSDPSNEGKFAAKLGTVNASYNDTQMSSSGVIEPVQEGDIVLLAFLDNSKTKPVIITYFHNIDDTENNIAPNEYSLDPTKSIEEHKEALKYLRVFPSQVYFRVDGDGGAEISLPSKTFLKIDYDGTDDMGDGHQAFDYDKLQEKDPKTKQTRTAYTEEAALPVKILFSHRSSDDDETTTWTKLFLDKDGQVRLTRDNNDGTLTYTSIDADGKYTVRRQLDSNVHGQGSKYTEISVDKDGTARMAQGNGSYVTMDKDGNINFHSSRDISMTADGDISIKAKGNMTVDGSTMDVGL